MLQTLFPGRPWPDPVLPAEKAGNHQWGAGIAEVAGGDIVCVCFLGIIEAHQGDIAGDTASKGAQG